MNTSCPSVEQLIEWASGRARGQLKQLLDAHLSACQACCARVAALAHPEGSASTIASRPSTDSTKAPTQPFDDHRDELESFEVGPTHSPSSAGRATRAAPAGVQVGTSLGRYVVVSELGTGGMGRVFSAYDPELDRKVAVKLLRSDLEDKTGADLTTRLLREAQVLARLSHPNVVSVYDVGTHSGQVFIAMEFVAGRSMTSWLSERPRTWREILDVFIAAGRGLAAAHEAGIIHRDFKPDNVLVGHDGTVRVVDFGLARPASEALASENRPIVTPVVSGRDRPLLDTPLTIEGTLMGTPAYMPPEQYRGAGVDAQADQFSFGVSLFEALYGQRPFRAADVQAYAQGKLAKLTPVVPSEGKVPAWVRKALVRAMAAEPSERYPSMRTLLEALEKDPAVRRRRVFGGTGALFLVAAIAAGASYKLEVNQKLCTGAEERLVGTWDAQRKQTLATTFLATNKPYAQAVFETVQSIFDAYTGAWVAMRSDACLATRVRGEQSEALLDQRMSCLDRRLTELGALLEVLSRADARVVEDAVAAAQALTPLERCSNTEALRSSAPLPKDETTRQRVGALRTELTRVKVLADAGRVAEAVKKASGLEGEVRKLAYAPLTAELLERLGALKQRVGDNRAAEALLYEASWVALSARELESTAKALTTLSLALLELGRTDEALRWGSFANGAILALGGDDMLQGRLHHVLGLVYQKTGDHPLALAHLEKCLSLREQRLGEDSVLVASTRTAFGGELHAGGRLEDAIAHHRKAIEAKVKRLGQSHPSLAPAYAALADALSAKGERSLAVEEQRKAVNVLTQALGDDDPETTKAKSALADALAIAGKLDEALALRRRVLDALLASLGKDHPDTAAAHAGLAELLAQKGERFVAVTELRSALASTEASFGAHTVRGAPHLTRIGELLIELGQSRHALKPLERAVALLAKDAPGGEGLPRARFALARALWASERSQHRAMNLARQALEGYQTMSGTNAQVASVREWLSTSSRAGKGFSKKK